MSMLNTIRWFLVPVAALLGGIFAFGVVHGIGQWLLGRWAITSGIVLFYSTASFVVGWTGTGSYMAPEKSLNVQRAIASPLLLLAVFGIYNTIVLFFGYAESDYDLLLLESIPPIWEYAIHATAFIFGLYNVFTDKL